MATGTVPAATRCARPSAMAVLPTPAAPTSAGLFFPCLQQDVDRSGDLFIAAADDLEPSGTRVGGEIACEARQRAGIGAFGTKGIVDHDTGVRGSEVRAEVPDCAERSTAEAERRKELAATHREQRSAGNEAYARGR
jgi:hypothetical protein